MTNISALSKITMPNRPKRVRRFFRRRQWTYGLRNRALLIFMGAVMTSWPLGTGAVPKLKPVAAPFAQPVEFSRALAAEYDTLIRREAQNYSSEFESAFFEKKLAMARANRATAPMEISRFGLEGAVSVALAEGRSRLTRAMGGRSLNVAPVLAARAQAAFDCWIERVSEKAAPAYTNKCRSEFLGSMRELERADRGSLAHVRLQFRRRSARLDKQGLETLRQVARKAIRSNALSVSIISSTAKNRLSNGASGGIGGNGLGQRRIENLAKKLREMGVRADRIRLLYIEETRTSAVSSNTAKRKIEPVSTAGQIAEIVIQ